MKGTASKLIHGNIEEQNDIHRALKTPLYETNAFDFASSDDVAAQFRGEKEAYAYSRAANPTVTELEKRLGLMSGAKSTLAVSSGMYAISSTLMSLCSKGDHIISSPFLFGHTYALLHNTFPNYGIDTSFVDLENASAIENAITPQTKVIFLENISNPQLIVFDIEMISAIAKKHNIILVVDNTLLTSYIFDCKKYGVDVEVISTTKAVSGGATVTGGAIMIFESEKWSKVPALSNYYEKFGQDALIKKLRKDVFRNTGGCTSPHTAHMQLIGLETLTLRVDKFCNNAIEVAKACQKNPKVKNVIYPALEDNEYKVLADKQFGSKCGCLVVLELENQDACYRFMDNLKMIRRATNFTDNKSLIIHPYSTIFCEYSEEQKAEMRLNDRMLRLAVGIEDAEDIIADIEQALK